jgi:acetyl esterase/lipase
MTRHRTTVCLLFATGLLTALLSDFTPSAVAVGPEPVLLWPAGAPGAQGEEPADKPDIRVYSPPRDKANGAAVVICPGGGYAVLAYDHEGHQVARFLNTIGVTGVVLKYRLAPRYRHPAPLQDVQRAVRLVRSKAADYGIDPTRVGVMGFSAGGHLASTAATHFDKGQADAADPVDRFSCRPDFAVLCYPVISMTESFGHTGSRRNLLGENADAALADLLSNEKQVTAETPPTFLFHTGDDTGVPVENSLAFYSALRKHKVPAELHAYQVGPHGVGLAPADPATFGWKDRLADWLRANSFLSTTTRAAVKGKVTLEGKPMRWGMVAFVPATGHQPLAWAMVSNGQFSLAANRGPVVGANRVLVYDLGAVEPRPTREDFAVIDKQLSAEIKDGMNELQFEIGK